MIHELGDPGLARIIDELREIRAEVQKVGNLPEPGAPDNFGPQWQELANRPIRGLRMAQAASAKLDAELDLPEDLGAC